jgi:phosphomannomutase
VLELMAHERKPLSKIVDALPTYAIVKDKYEVSRDRLPALESALLEKWPEARANRLDGLRLDWADRWVHVRPSNTEPIVRVIAEAPTEPEARTLCTEVGARIRGRSD